jgi:hypothetical protein
MSKKYKRTRKDPNQLAAEIFALGLRQQGLPPQPIVFLRKLYGFRIFSDGQPDGFTRAAIYMGLGEEDE